MACLDRIDWRSHLKLDDDLRGRGVELATKVVANRRWCLIVDLISRMDGLCGEPIVITNQRLVAD